MNKIEEKKFSQMSFSFDVAPTGDIHGNHGVSFEAPKNIYEKCIVLTFPRRQSSEISDQDLILRILQRSKGFAE